MNDIQFNPNLQRAEDEPELTDAQLAELEKKRTHLKQQAEAIITLAESQTNSALNCLHKINVLGGTTEKAYTAVQQRILQDQDAHGAYHAIAMAQSTSDLPFDVPKLIEVVLQHGEPALQFRLLKLFDTQPLTAPPLPQLIEAIQTADDGVTVEALQQYLQTKLKN
ncbi:MULTISPECIES: hypothetical protein [unclassified Moraxella]|uniref:hypothetical protein n=1 Tax=unclassified Moraxella TaxID=2685852 RepID=UPI003AF7D503